MANPVLKGGAMRRGSLDKVFIQVAIIAAIIILLTIWIR
ncbi:MAG: magnesium transporter protection protein MgtU [Klebsiella oxytoca]|nr:magnesium transporter protection protein MgtU [Klebsiella oxytoca]